MGTDTQMQVTRTIEAPAGRVFAVLGDPREHAAIDGSGLLQGSDSDRVTAVGQVFTMRMYRDDLGPWRTFNTVTTFEDGRRIGWAPELDPDSELGPKLAHLTTGGHTYVYELEERDGVTEVTQTYDWSTLRDPQFAAFCPFVSADDLRATLDRLAAAVEGARPVTPA
ncbi:SRPBCC family protein [Actinomycetospora soli]|uniref:SRPBCC family protein n=1 Tax=Actinomycetospora soli TaxID=2893887 RepID=UPI001E65DB38|nr:SRPBCC family protein [Actinomycetospora soli]MCD2185866.1 SRPBCC family protein [Actinomycetospora soli]